MGRMVGTAVSVTSVMLVGRATGMVDRAARLAWVESGVGAGTAVSTVHAVRINRIKIHTYFMPSSFKK